MIVWWCQWVVGGWRGESGLMWKKRSYVIKTNNSPRSDIPAALSSNRSPGIGRLSWTGRYSTTHATRIALLRAPPSLITAMTEFDTLIRRTHTRIPNRLMNIKRFIIVQFIQALLFTRWRDEIRPETSHKDVAYLRPAELRRLSRKTGPR